MKAELFYNEETLKEFCQFVMNKYEENQEDFIKK